MRPYLRPRDALVPRAPGPIPFSRYLEKHNREDRADLSRNAVPVCDTTHVLRSGDLLDVYA